MKPTKVVKPLARDLTTAEYPEGQEHWLFVVRRSGAVSLLQQLCFGPSLRRTNRKGASYGPLVRRPPCCCYYCYYYYIIITIITTIVIITYVLLFYFIVIIVIMLLFIVVITVDY